MDVVGLTRRLADLPSYVDKRTDERACADLCIRWIKENLRTYRVRKMPVADGRYNILITPKRGIRTLFTAHLDTVPPSGTWNRAKVSNGKVFGLGAVDMKGALAAMLCALRNAGAEGTAGLLLYVDEEYGFKGMETALRKIRQLPKPKIIITGEPTDLQLSQGCRGFADLRLTVRGTTAHSARPMNGISVVKAFSIVEATCERLAKSARHPQLGKTLVNVYYAEMGNRIRDEGSETVTASDNRLPDILKMRISLRIASRAFDPREWKRKISANLRSRGLKLETFEVAELRKPMFTSGKALQRIRRRMQDSVGSSSAMPLAEVGYYDVQMLAERWNIPAISIGAGPRSSAHTSVEHVSCSDLKKLEHLYTSIALTC